jgi:hypothetical protein
LQPDSGIVRAGGVALVLAAVAFMAVFGYLAATFHYPEVLDGPAVTVLPNLLATGATGRAVWALYAFLPLLWIPAGVGAFHAYRRESEGSMRVAMQFALVSSVAMMLGLLRWPSIHWELARAYASATPDQRPVLDAIFLGLNRYLGNYIGEFLGECCINLFFLLTALAILRTGRSRFVAWLGILSALAGFVAMFRNVTDAVSIVSEVNNYLLPIWMIVLGVTLLRHRPQPA